MRNLDSQARSALYFSGVGVAAKDVLGLVSGVWIARLIAPEVFGVFGLAQASLGLLGVFSAQAVLEHAFNKRDPDAVDWPSFFWLGLSINGCAALAAYLFLLRFISQRSQGEILWPLLLMPLVFVLELGSGVRFTYLQAQHRWKRYRTLLFLGSLFSAVCVLVGAACGYPLLALVVGPIALLVPAVVDWIRAGPFVHWPPRLGPSWKADLEFGFQRSLAGSSVRGAELALAGLLSSALGPASFGQWMRARGLLQLTVFKFADLVLSSLFPVLTRLPAGSQRYQVACSRMVCVVLSLILPGVVGLSQVCPTLIPLAYGPGWDPASSYLPAAAGVVAMLTAVAFVSRFLAGSHQAAAATALAFRCGGLIVFSALAFFLLDLLMFPRIASALCVLISLLGGYCALVYGVNRGVLVARLLRFCILPVLFSSACAGACLYLVRPVPDSSVVVAILEHSIAAIVFLFAYLVVMRLCFRRYWVFVARGRLNRIDRVM